MAKFVANYDEDKVPDYTLPDPLIFEDGTKVENAAMWERRRAEILALFETQVYGKMPGAAAGMHFETRFVNGDALEGICKEVRVFLLAACYSLSIFTSVTFSIRESSLKKVSHSCEFANLTRKLSSTICDFFIRFSSRRS